MTPTPLKLAPSAIPTGDDRQWLDRIARCTTSIARTLESRQIRTNEVPLILGALVIALADHTETPLEKVIGMVSKAARELTIATPAQAPDSITP